MSNQPDPAQYLAKLFATSQELMQKIAAGAPGTAQPSGPDPTAWFMAAMNNVAEMQAGYLQQMTQLWTAMLAPTAPGGAAGTGTAAPKADDKRFAGEAWRSMPGFDLIKNTYLAYAGALRDCVEAAPVDEKTKGQMRFAVRQFNDALSPANFFATNPEAMQLAMQTGGKSVAEGMVKFFEDLAKGRVSTTDETAFQVGKNLAVTPGAVIFENDLMQVIQYAPRTARVCARPLLIIPPAINKFYILDLQPKNSLVAFAVEQGHTVFLVSWRNISPALGSLTWDDYVEKGVVQAIDVALEVTGADRINALGFCVGGTLLACAAAVLNARQQDKLASLTLLTALLDFSDTGEIGLLVSEQSVALREATIGRGGVVDGKELAFVFSSLRANDLIWPYVVSRYLKGQEAPAFDLLYWNSDGTNLPGPMFCWYLRHTYLENDLKEPGKTRQCGVPVDLSQVKAPAYLYASREDHIVPWKTAYASTRILGGETTFVLGASGHIAGVINPASGNKRNYWTAGAGTAADAHAAGGAHADADAEAWFASAQSVPGSWWPHWATWLKLRAGDEVAARASLGGGKYRLIEPAPGRYVTEQVAASPVK
jgi:polyhydroxyalkanoate synthase